MIFHTGFYAVIVTHDFAVQRMGSADLVEDSIASSGAHVIKLRVAFAYYGLPDEQLGSNQMREIFAPFILASPACGNGSRIAILENPADVRFDLIGRDRAVQPSRVVIPKVFIPLGQYIASILRNSWFDTVAGSSGIRMHGTDSCNI